MGTNTLTCYRFHKAWGRVFKGRRIALRELTIGLLNALAMLGWS